MENLAGEKAVAGGAEAISETVVAELVAAAAAVRGRAYAPYSHFAVGAALLADDGTIHVGCNVENASYGLTICAERNAVAHGVAAGRRNFTALAVVTDNAVTPCGACRQVLAEFNPHLLVIVADGHGNQQRYRLSELLPAAFGPEDLSKIQA
ncbi:MAG: cytidine deaminase [Anaerolineae bacterium]